MSFQDSSRILYRDVEKLSPEVLSRWLLWVIKDDPAETRIRRESLASKAEILRALVWMGAVS